MNEDKTVKRCDNMIMKLLLRNSSWGNLSDEYIIYALGKKFTENMIKQRLQRLVEQNIIIKHTTRILKEETYGINRYELNHNREIY